MKGVVAMESVDLQEKIVAQDLYSKSFADVQFAFADLQVSFADLRVSFADT